MSKPTSLFYFMYLILGVVLIWFAFAMIILIKGDLPSLGQFGDSFGVLNVLFGGLGFSALVYTILLQQEQLREMQLQRISMYKADLSFMGNISVWANFRNEDDGQLDIFFSSMPLMADDRGTYKAYVKLRNIGIGVAKEINYTWDLDIEKIKVLINNFEIKLEGSFIGVKNEKYNMEHYYRFPLNVRENLFLLPYSHNADNFIDVVIPDLYLLLLTLYIFQFSSDRKDFQQYMVKFPSLNLIINYNDMIGTKSMLEVKFGFSNLISSSSWNHILTEKASFSNYSLKVTEKLKV